MSIEFFRSETNIPGLNDMDVFLTATQGEIDSLNRVSVIALHELWARIRARTDLPTLPAEWMEGNGTGYYDDIMEKGSLIPLGVFFKGTDRYGRMVVVCRPMSGAGEVHCWFDRYKPAPTNPVVVCQQRRGGGADVDCNGDATEMYVALSKALVGSKFSNERHFAELAAA